MAIAKSKAPTGLSITRSGNTYTFKWKIGDKDYGDGQLLWYRINGGGWAKPAIGRTATTYTVTNASVKSISFAVKGNRKAYKTGKTTINPTWSKWSIITWTATVPGNPSLTYENTGVNSGKFTWAFSPNNTNTEIFKRVESQTCTVRKNATPSNNEWGAVTSRAASGNQAITESSASIAAGNLVRWYRVRTVGAAGALDWSRAAYSYHAYGAPNPATLRSANAVSTGGSSSKITATWNGAYDRLHPIDSIKIQYVIDVPTDVAMTAPNSGWNDALEVKPNGSNDRVVVNVADTIAADQCMWVRIMTEHDTNVAYSNEMVAQIGELVAPSINAVPNATTGDVAITITENTSCQAACTAIFYRSANDPSNDRIIAILPNGTTTTTVNVPDVIGAATTCFGAYAFVGTYTGTVITSIKMQSPVEVDSDIIAVPPANVTASAGPVDGAVRIGWEWSWDNANIAELSWADNDFAWQSTAQPSTYKVEDIYSNTWVIMGLETGKRWYFRVRLIDDSEDEEVVGPWSELVSYDLTGIPDKPVLNLNKTVINEGESFIAKWAYSSSAETDTQAYAEICEVTYSGTTPVYGNLVAYTETSQSIVIDNDWTTGTVHYLAVRVTSTSGTQSDWSEPINIYVAPPVTIAISATSLASTTVDDETLYTLTEMPLTATITGAGNTGTTILTVTRAEDYHLYRPDDKDFDGFEGESIVSYTQTGEDAITITVDDLVGRLDDTARYILKATVIDEYDQTISAEIPFTVDWSHKAEVPGIIASADKIQRIMKITPVAPDNYVAGDTCDIYRISADQPELIYKGAVFGTTYVDPYPAFGDFCGHRLVTVTANGDYTTASGIGWYDANYADGDILEDDKMIIDVDGNQIELPYDLSLSNKWNKDFKRTSYLGGSVQGDWNPAVTRDLSADSVLIRGDDLDRQLAMRDLAGYAGVAHVRTPDGSSLTADVQINESQAYDTKKVSYSLTIQAIDPQDPDGMTLEEWNELHPIGS